MNPIMRWANQRAVARIRRKGGKFYGSDVLVLNTVGNKTGAERANPVGWFAGDDGAWLIVASANGAPHNPAWFHNLVGNPDRVTIDIDRRNVAVTPTVLQGVERERAWASITAKAPRFAQYEKKTDRVMPVIRLTPR
jgi:deazaflavin-dependent oxidoreductase (nitroreductase family)